MVVGDGQVGVHQDAGKVALDLRQSGPDLPFGIGPAQGGYAHDASPETAEAIEREVHGFLSSCHRRAREILLENRGILEEMAQTLLECEVLDGEDMERYLAQVALADELAEPPTGEIHSLVPGK